MNFGVIDSLGVGSLLLHPSVEVTLAFVHALFSVEMSTCDGSVRIWRGNDLASAFPLHFSKSVVQCDVCCFCYAVLGILSSFPILCITLRNNLHTFVEKYRDHGKSPDLRMTSR
jgi:hypothetical protein